jgi:hypothetical protein
MSAIIVRMLCQEARPQIYDLSSTLPNVLLTIRTELLLFCDRNYSGKIRNAPVKVRKRKNSMRRSLKPNDGVSSCAAIFDPENGNISFQTAHSGNDIPRI